MKRANYILIASIAAGIEGCAPVRFLPSQIEYQCTAPFKDPAFSNEFVTGFTGSRGFKNGTRQFTHSFTFNSPDDYVRVCIHDTAGISPGRFYLLTLKHIDKSQKPMTSQQYWTLTVANPSKKEVIFDQCFEGRVSGGQFDLINPTPVEGNWMISRTDRAITADLYVYSKNDVVADKSLEPPCQLY